MSRFDSWKNEFEGTVEEDAGKVLHNRRMEANGMNKDTYGRSEGEERKWEHANNKLQGDQQLVYAEENRNNQQFGGRTGVDYNNQPQQGFNDPYLQQQGGFGGGGGGFNDPYQQQQGGFGGGGGGGGHHHHHQQQQW